MIYSNGVPPHNQHLKRCFAHKRGDLLVPLPVDEIHITGFEAVRHIKSVAYDNKPIHLFNANPLFEILKLHA